MCPREECILSANHLYSVQVLEWQDYFGLVMEYASGGTLYSVVLRSHGLPEADARWYFQQIVMAIDFCHQMVCKVSLNANISEGSSNSFNDMQTTASMSL